MSDTDNPFYILVLDDETSFKEFIQEIVLKSDSNLNSIFRVKGFTNPEEFKSNLNNQVSIAILDVRLPGYNNYDVFDMVDYLSVNHHSVNVIIMSGYVDDDMLFKAIRRGVADVIKKDNDWHLRLKETFIRLLPHILTRFKGINA